MEYRTLWDTDSFRIYQTFIQAFSDYQVSVDMPFESFETRLKRNGYVSEFSAGAFEGDELVGFVLNGVRNWNGEKTIYDLGTAVIPECRKKGVTSSLLELVNNLCIEKNIKKYQLEVIQNNTDAVSLYKKQGFEVIRELNCYCTESRMNKSEKPVKWKLHHAEQILEEQWEIIQNFWNYPPSWQNSIDSVCVVGDSFFYTLAEKDGELIGYGIVEKTRGDIVQLAVKKEYRRKGVAADILYDLQNQINTEKMTIVNVDGRDEALNTFLGKMGWKLYVTQYEMERWNGEK